MSEWQRGGLLLAVLLGYFLFCAVVVWRYRRRQPRPAPPAEGPALLVAYASQSGRAQALAQQCAAAVVDQAVRLLPLNQVDEALLANTQRALFVASTYGEGEAPENALRFSRRYLSDRPLNLSHLNYAVLALGDRRYPQFCAFGHALHSGLVRHGATALFAPLELCAQQAANDDPAQALQRWQPQLQQLGVGALAPMVTAPPAVDFLPWTLVRRQMLNPGSPGAPLYRLWLTPPPALATSWRAGDIAQILAPQAAQPLREYSIASLPGDGCLELLVRQQRNDNGRLGLVSGWLTTAALGQPIALRLRSNPDFHAPEPAAPLILIGNGSGFAGLRAHLRACENHGQGGHWLVFGERCPAADGVFADELAAWQLGGHLARVDLAFSRCPSRPAYVQDCLREAASELREWLAAGATILVCGSRRGMAEAVDQCLREVLGEAAVDALAAGRYRRDVY